VNSFALLLGYLITLLVGFIGALLLRHGPALLLGNIDALLAGDIVAHRVGNLLLFLLWNIFTIVVGIILASSLYGHPHFGGSLALPVIFTVLFVLDTAFCFGVLFVLCAVRLGTHFVVHSFTLPVLHRGALLAGNILALLFVLRTTLVDVDCGALLLLCFRVLGVPGGDVLCAAGHA